MAISGCNRCLLIFDFPYPSTVISCDLIEIKVRKILVQPSQPTTFVYLIPVMGCLIKISDNSLFPSPAGFVPYPLLSPQIRLQLIMVFLCLLLVSSPSRFSYSLSIGGCDIDVPPTPRSFFKCHFSFSFPSALSLFC